MSKIKSFISKYNWKGTSQLSGKDSLKTFEKNNSTTAVNVLYITNMNIYPAYISKRALNHANQIILLRIRNGEGWHYLAVKKLSK